MKPIRPIGGEPAKTWMVYVEAVESERDRYRESLTWMGRYTNCTDRELRENGWSREGCLAHARTLTDLL